MGVSVVCAPEGVATSGSSSAIIRRKRVTHFRDFIVPPRPARHHRHREGAGGLPVFHFFIGSHCRVFVPQKSMQSSYVAGPRPPALANRYLPTAVGGGPATYEDCIDFWGT